VNLALNDAANVIEYYRAGNEAVEVDIVPHGPGPLYPRGRPERHAISARRQFHQALFA
jgi:hypothetical protein